MQLCFLKQANLTIFFIFLNISKPLQLARDLFTENKFATFVQPENLSYNQQKAKHEGLISII